VLGGEPLVDVIALVAHLLCRYENFVGLERVDGFTEVHNRTSLHEIAWQGENGQPEHVTFNSVTNRRISIYQKNVK
jgi:hypothetical protein